MTLRHRLAKLEGIRGGNGPDGPTVIFLFGGTDGEALTALQMGGGTLSRNDGETEADFIARAGSNPSVRFFLPDNQRA